MGSSLMVMSSFSRKFEAGVWIQVLEQRCGPFLLGVYDFNSSKEERDSFRSQKRKEYERLRKQCCQILKRTEKSGKLKGTSGNICNEDRGDLSHILDSPGLEDMVSGWRCNFAEGGSPVVDDSDYPCFDHSHQTPLFSDSFLEGDADKSVVTSQDACIGETESSDSDSSEENENTILLSSENSIDKDYNNSSSTSHIEGRSASHTDEDFATWRRIILLDAVRANDEWIVCTPSQSAVSTMKAQMLLGLFPSSRLMPFTILRSVTAKE